jgi:hypothetical protein
MFFILIVSQGCAILTNDQIKAVDSLAKAGVTVSEIPINVIKTHGEILYTENLYEVAATNQPNIETITSQVNRAIETKQKYLQKAKQAEKSLKVLSTYSNLLVKLTSDEFSEKLGNEAVVLGKELDDAIGEYNDYNEEHGSKYPEVGSWGKYVSALVRGAGGIYIKTEQAKALKKAVKEAEPQIGLLSKSVVALMKKYTDTYGPLAVDGVQETYLRMISVDIKNRNTIDNLEDYILTLEKAKSIATLSEQGRKSVLAFEKAHTKLNELLKKKQDIKGGIAELEVLVDEVDAAKKTMKELEK